MAASLVTGSLVMAADIKFSLTNTQTDGSVQTDPFDDNRFALLPSDADRYFHKLYSLTGNGTQDIELDSLTDVFGNAIVFSKIYAFLIQNLATASGRFISIGDTDFAAWLGATGDKVKIGPKGCLFVASTLDGYTVTSSTADTMTITNGTNNAVDIKVTIVGKA